MNAIPTVLVWLGLLLLLLVEYMLAYFPALRFAVPFIGLAMAALVALTFMRLGASRGLVPIFAIAGVFWLCVILGLGSMDAFTRRDIPVGHFDPNGPAPGIVGP